MFERIKNGIFRVRTYLHERLGNMIRARRRRNHEQVYNYPNNIIEPIENRNINDNIKNTLVIKQPQQEEQKQVPLTIDQAFILFDKQIFEFQNDQNLKLINESLENSFQKLSFQQYTCQGLVEQTQELERIQKKIKTKYLKLQAFLSNDSQVWNELYINVNSLILTAEQKEFYFNIDCFNFRQLRQVFQMKGSNGNPIVIHPNLSVKISPKNLQTLKYGQWLNDEVVNGFIELITAYNQIKYPCAQVLILNSFIYNLLINADKQKIVRISQKKQITNTVKQILLPLNPVNMHWSLMFIDREKKRLIYFDSLGNIAQSVLNKLLNIVNVWDEYFPLQSDHIQGLKLEYTLEKGSCPKQENTFDCGVFMLKNIQILSTGLYEETLGIYSQDLIFYDRIQIGTSLLKGKIN